MNKELSNFAARLREMISRLQLEIGESQFSEIALELFALQFKDNPAYQKICEARGRTPEVIEHWTQIPFVPMGAFKELEMTSLEPDERTAVFYSSGTTDQKPSRHFHNAGSLAIYEASLWKWFEQNALNCELRIANCELIVLTPPPEQAPNSSLVHMFEIIRQKIGRASVPASRNFLGKISVNGSWTLDFEKAFAALNFDSQYEIRIPKLLLGTAFSFVHLLDYLAENNLRLQLPENSRVMETGGYKNRSRSLPKAELHSLIEKFLGVPRENIICEYGMSELSSQAYEIKNSKFKIKNLERRFHFPPWARAQIISPETNKEVRDGESGLIRIFDLANVFSVAAIQTDDLGIRRGDRFELIGRAQLAEARGCSLMTV